MGCSDQLGLQLTGQQQLVDIVQHLAHQLGHDEGLLLQGMPNAQLRHQEYSACTTQDCV